MWPVLSHIDLFTEKKNKVSKCDRLVVLEAEHPSDCSGHVSRQNSDSMPLNEEIVLSKAFGLC